MLYNIHVSQSQNEWSLKTVLSDPKPNGHTLEEKNERTNKVRTGVQFHDSVTQLTPKTTSWDRKMLRQHG